MLTISGAKQRLAAAAILGALVVPILGVAPSVADTPATGSPTYEAVCPAPAPQAAQCLALRRTDIPATPSTGALPQSTSGNGPYGPADIRSAYALPAGNEGAGLTVAVVDAFDLPSAEADLAVYRSHFGLPPCTTANGCFRKVNQHGLSGPYPAADNGWGGEIALDIQMISATCPHCNILLVEADNNNLNNLGTAVNTAVAMGAVAVSNSYGGTEWSGEAAYDTAYYNHPGVAITASTGDCGYNCAGNDQHVSYPSASPYVIAVGGTSLRTDASARGWTESAWGNADGGAGSGCSLYEPKPAWQTDPTCSKRNQADVSAVADPATGVHVYVSGNWRVFGGTSASSPIIAAVYALAGRPSQGDYPASYLYADPADLNDVTIGNNDATWGNCSVTYYCNGVAGYDGPTGLGTPKGTRAFARPTAPGKPTSLVATPGDGSAGLAWTAPTSASSAITGYTVTETEQDLGVVPCTTASAASCTVGNLTNGTEYTFTIHATNAHGDGAESDPSNSVKPAAAAIPGAPTGVRAIGGIASAAVSWSAAASHGSAIGAYVATSAPDGKTCATTGALTCSVTGLIIGRAYTFTVTATNGLGDGPPSGPSPPVTPITGATYHPVAPVRLLDTRYGNGLSGKLVATTPRTFGIAGRGGIPANATAITGNATVVSQSAASSIYIGPDPIARPGIPTLNFNKGQITAYSVTVALSTAGNVSVTYMAASGTTDLVLDVTGYFTPDTTGGTYHPLTPARLLDTRYGNGLSGKLVANTPRTFAVRNRGGVPASATAVTGNVTVVNSTSSWAVYLGPSPIAKPASSTINFVKGQVQSNSLTVALGTGGTLSATFISGAGSRTDLVFDVTGYYTPDLTGATYVPVTPARLLDTRVAVGLTGKVAANTPRRFQVTGRGGIPSSAVGITGITSVYNQTNAWALFVGPVATSKPSTSNLNFLRGDLKSNAVTVALGSGGTLTATYMSSARNTTHVVVDVTGYFLAPAPNPATTALDLFDARAQRWQNPDFLACTAASTMSMLNTVAYSGSTTGFTWHPTTSYDTQEAILAYERAHMTMSISSAGTDPHGWRNALNYYGWGSLTAGVYRDSAYTSFDAAAKAAVSALARYGRPVGILALAGGHAQFITGYQVTGDDPRTGSQNFAIIGIDLTDPLQSAAHRDTWVTYADWRSGGTWVKFSPYVESDSPYRDSIDGRIGYDEWHGKWVIIDPVK